MEINTDSLFHCRTCAHTKTDPKVGRICGVTKEKAQKGYCIRYDRDEEESNALRKKLNREVREVENVWSDVKFLPIPVVLLTVATAVLLYLAIHGYAVESAVDSQRSYTVHLFAAGPIFTVGGGIRLWYSYTRTRDKRKILLHRQAEFEAVQRLYK